MPADSTHAGEEFLHQFKEKKGTYFANRAEYSHALAIVLHWKDHDLDNVNKQDPQYSVVSETQSVFDFFQKELNFETTTFALPSADSGFELLLFLLHAIDSLRSNESALLVLYYAGHNGAGTDGKAHLAAFVSSWIPWPELKLDSKSEGGPSLSWSDIDTAINKIRGDVILLLDCCEAALITQSMSRKPAGRFEVLAASAKGVATPRPGPRSFTTVLVKEMKALLRERSYIDCNVLHSRLDQNRALTETPFRFSSSLNPSARAETLLRPLKAPGEPVVGRRAISHLLMNISLAEEPRAEHLVNWLKANAPESVTDVSIEAAISRAQAWQQCLGQDTAIGPLLSKLSERALKEITDHLHQLNGTVRHVVSLANTEGLETYATAALEEVESATSRVEDAVTTFCLLDLTEADLSATLISSSVLVAEETELALTLRRGVSALQTQAAELRIPPDTLVEFPQPVQTASRGNRGARFSLRQLRGRTVIVESFAYEPDAISGAPSTRAENQVLRMAALLRLPKRPSFNMLQGAGYVTDHINQEFGMVFELPLGLARPLAPKGLRSYYQACQRMELGARIILAQKLASALDELHRVGWLHKNINSGSILFLSERDTDVVLGQPWLFGFEYSRPEEAETYLDEDHSLEANVYRHPDRWGSPRTKFVRAHDVHSLGIVMAEIAFWQPILGLLPLSAVSPPLKARAYVQDLRNKCQRKLPHMVGQKFADAIDACFNYEEKTKGMSEFEAQRYFQAAVKGKLSY